LRLRIVPAVSVTAAPGGAPAPGSAVARNRLRKRNAQAAIARASGTVTRNAAPPCPGR
jgi:hypothetical protein